MFGASASSRGLGLIQNVPFSSARKRLAIRAMAYPDVVGIDFRDVGNVAAMTPAIDLHNSLHLVFGHSHRER